MNEDIKQIKTTVETLADSVKSISESIGGLTTHIVELDKRIDDLAISTKNEFDRVHFRLSDLDQKVDVVDRKVDVVDQKVNMLNQKVDTLDVDVDNLAILCSKEISKVHIKLAEMDENLVDYHVSRKQYVSLDKRVHKLETVAFAQ